MLHEDLLMLSAMMLLFLKMAVCAWSYFENKFGGEICLCSIHECACVLMKTNDRFLFAIAWWSCWCPQLRFLGKFVKFDLGKGWDIAATVETLVLHCIFPDFLLFHVAWRGLTSRANQIISFMGQNGRVLISESWNYQTAILASFIPF